MNITTKPAAYCLLVLTTLFWGVSFVLVDRAIEHIDSYWFNSLRFLVAGLLLLPFAIHGIVKTKHRYRLAFLSMVSGGVLYFGFITQTLGLKYTSVSNAGFITGLNVVIVPIIMVMIQRRSLPLSNWLSALLALLGLYVLTEANNLAGNRGDFLVLLCAFAFAIHVLIIDQLSKLYSVIALTALQLLSVSLFAALSASAQKIPFPPTDSLSSSDVMSGVLITALLATAFAYWAQIQSQKILPPQKIALLFTMEPVFAYLAAYIFLGERFSVIGISGAMLILVSMLLAEVTGAQKTVEEPFNP